MNKDPHFAALERMYNTAASINDYFKPRLEVRDGEATVELDVRPDFFHAAGAIHGCAYFKVLDDAAFFAANSVERETFVLTTSFTTYLTRPVTEGVLRAEGRLLNRTRSQFIAEAVAFDSSGREVARGNGLFVRGKARLETVRGYGA